MAAITGVSAYSTEVIPRLGVPVNEHAMSLQALIRRRQHENFVGRDGQIAHFRENLELAPDDARKYFVFNVHGDGGVGKTYLMRQLQGIAGLGGSWHAYTDESVYDVPETMAKIASQLGESMRDFLKRYDAYVKRRDQVARDPQAPLEAWSRVTRTAVKVGLHASKAIPGAGPIIDLIDGDTTAAAADRLRVYLAGKFSDGSDIRLLLNPIEELTPEFVNGLNRAATGRPLVLFLDTYERTAPVLDSWLLDLLAGRFGALPPSLVLVIAGQKPLDVGRWSDYLSVIASVPLEPFTEAEARQLMAEKGIVAEPVVQTILQLSGRLPLLVAMLAESRPETPGDIGDPSGTAVERFLKWEHDPVRRATVLAGALPRRIDSNILAVLFEGSDVAETFRWMCGLPFISARAGYYEYHEVVRSPMIRLERAQSPVNWRDAHRRLAGAHRAWRHQDSPNEAWSDPGWLHHRVEEVYHGLCGGLPDSRIDAFDLTVAAARGGVATARQWAEMLHDVGKDAQIEEFEQFGELLLATVDDQRQDCRDFLTVVLDAKNLTNSAKVEALVERGRIFFYANSDELAVADLTDALRHDKGSSEAYKLRGAAHLWLLNFSFALEDLTRAIELKPDDEWALGRRGATYLEMGRYEDALTDVNRALELKPDDTWALGRRGETYQRMERYEDALTDFNRILEFEPDDTWALGLRSETYQRMERYEDALTDLNQVLELKPDTEWALALRSRIYEQMGRYEDALTDLNQVLELKPDTEWALALRSRIYEQMERYEDALTDFNRALELEPDDTWALGRRGETYQRMERYEDALTDLNRALELKPDDQAALGSRAEVYRRMERYGDAVTDFNRILELEPDTEWALGLRGETYQRMERYEDALTDFNRILELKPDTEWAFGLRAVIYQQMERYEDALTDVNRILELEPDDTWALGLRAVIYQQMERYEDALTDFNRALHLKPDDTWALGLRGATYQQMERYEDALTDFNRALHLKPDDEFAQSSRDEVIQELHMCRPDKWPWNGPPSKDH